MSVCLLTFLLINLCTDLLDCSRHARLIGRELARFSVLLPHLSPRHILYTPQHRGSQIAKELKDSSNAKLLKKSLFYPTNATETGDFLEWRIVDLESGLKQQGQIEKELREAVNGIFIELPDIRTPGLRVCVRLSRPEFSKLTNFCRAMVGAITTTKYFSFQK